MSWARTLSLAVNNNTNAAFQAWGSAVRDAFANSGWLQANGVGTQIDWTTVATPGGVNQSVGYEIWQMNDALQNTTPVYVKLEYGSGYAGAAPSLFLTVGSGANASGNVTGNLVPRSQLGIGSYGATVITCYFSGSAARITIALWVGTNASTIIPIILGIERTCNETGAYTADGIVIFAGASGGHYQLAWTPTTGNTTPWETSWGFLTPGAVANSGLQMGVSGTYLATYPCFFSIGTMVPSCMFLAQFGEFTPGQYAVVPAFGTNTTYMPIGNNAVYASSPRGGNRQGLLMRYE